MKAIAHWKRERVAVKVGGDGENVKVPSTARINEPSPRGKGDDNSRLHSRQTAEASDVEV